VQATANGCSAATYRAVVEASARLALETATCVESAGHVAAAVEPA
jgi:hypothetical protein